MNHILCSDELWKPVVGHEGRYEVSDQGRVRSLDRIQTIGGPKPHTRQLRGRILKKADSGIGYEVVTLDWKRGTSFVHRLVLEAFAGPCPAGHEGRHLDDNRSDNRLCNLAWGTQGDNYRDAQRNGRRTGRRSRKAQQ